MVLSKPVVKSVLERFPHSCLHSFLIRLLPRLTGFTSSTIICILNAPTNPRQKRRGGDEVKSILYCFNTGCQWKSHCPLWYFYWCIVPPHFPIVLHDSFIGLWFHLNFPLSSVIFILVYYSTSFSHCPSLFFCLFELVYYSISFSHCPSLFFCLF